MPIFNWIARKQASFFSIRRNLFSTQQLPILEKLLDRVNSDADIEKSLKNTAVVYVHHALQTSVNLLDGIIHLGAKPDNIFILGKKYSESTDVVKKMLDRNIHYRQSSSQTGLGRFDSTFTSDINWLWLDVISHLKTKNDIENVIIFDHGGFALSFTPAYVLENYKVVGVEKTSAGFIKLANQGDSLSFPVISVAGSAAKKILEPPLIADAIVEKLSPLIPSIQNQIINCGVVGYGAIGKAIAAKLHLMGHRVMVYDHDAAQLNTAKAHPSLIPTNSLAALSAFSEYIFGCTGRDITEGNIDCFRLSSKKQVGISCSSADTEFLSLLHLIQQKTHKKNPLNPFADVEYQTPMGGTLRLVKGGFPVNFDDSGESVRPLDIQLTRALVLGSAVQAAKFFKDPEILNKNGVYMLDPSIQKFVATEWLKQKTANVFPTEMSDNFQNPKWIEKHSDGIANLCTIFEEEFSSPSKNLRI